MIASLLKWTVASNKLESQFKTIQLSKLVWEIEDRTNACLENPRLFPGAIAVSASDPGLLTKLLTASQEQL